MATPFSSYGKAAVLPPSTRPARQPSAAVVYGTTAARPARAAATVPAPIAGSVTHSPANPPQWMRDAGWSDYDIDGWYKGIAPATGPARPPRPGTTPTTPGGGTGVTPTPTTPRPTTPKPTTPAPGSGSQAPANPGGPMPGSQTGIGTNPYLSSLLGGDPSGGFASQYTENQQNAVLTNPDLMGRGVLRQMGLDPESGYGSLIADDAQAVAPLVAYLMSQSGQADPATTLNSVGQLLRNRATAGGTGAIDESVFGQILNPQSQAARTMLGMGGNGISDLSPEQQIDLVNRMVGAGMDLGLNPYMGNATANWLNNAQNRYQEQIAMGGAGATDPYAEYLRAQGLATMFTQAPR